MAADFTQFPIQTATIPERAASNPATLPLTGTEALLLSQGGTTKGATAANIAALATKQTVGLDNVDNTSDANKPVSTAQATAIAAAVSAHVAAADPHPVYLTATEGNAAYEVVGAAAAAQAAAISTAAADATTKANAAQAAAIAASAPAAQGVTGGNSHDHNGGDGGQIAYSSLSGLPGLVNSSTAGLARPQDFGDVIVLACSDETTDLADGIARVTFRMPWAATLTGVRLNVNTAPTGSALIVDVNEAGVSVFSTRPQIDISAKTSVGSSVTPVISDSALAADAEITVDIDQVGSTIKGKGLKVALYLTRD